MTYSYNKLSANKLNIIRELIKHVTRYRRELIKHVTRYRRIHDVSMMKDQSLFKQPLQHVHMTDYQENKHDKIKVKHNHKFAISKHA
jgi:hypothetical protein